VLVGPESDKTTLPQVVIGCPFIKRNLRNEARLFKSILGPSHRLQYEQARALKKALVLYHWISSAPTKEIEEAHHLFFGAIKKMGEEFSWLVEAIRSLRWPRLKGGRSRSPIK